MIRVWVQQVQAHPEVALSVHMDDLTQEVVDDTPGRAVGKLRGSAWKLKEGLEDELNLKISVHKCAVFAGDNATEDMIIRQLGKFAGGRSGGSVRHLGADFVAGRRARKAPRAPTRSAGLDKVKKKLKRAMRLMGADRGRDNAMVYWFVAFDSICH